MQKEERTTSWLDEDELADHNLELILSAKFTQNYDLSETLLRMDRNLA